MTSQEIYVQRGYIVLGWFSAEPLAGSTLDPGGAYLQPEDGVCQVRMKVVGETDEADWLEQALLAEMPMYAVVQRYPHYYRVMAE